VARGLRAFRRTQLQAAAAIGKSPSLISRVLGRGVISQPCLDALAAWINRGAPLEEAPVPATNGIEGAPC
jgi:hypothetical protein